MLLTSSQEYVSLIGTLSPIVAAEYPYQNKKLTEQNTLFACKKSVAECAIAGMAECAIAESTTLGYWGSSKTVWILYFLEVKKSWVSVCIRVKKATHAGK